MIRRKGGGGYFLKLFHKIEIKDVIRGTFPIYCSIKIEYTEREHKEAISKPSHRISSSSLVINSAAIYKEIIFWN